MKLPNAATPAEAKYMSREQQALLTCAVNNINHALVCTYDHSYVISDTKLEAASIQVLLNHFVAAGWNIERVEKRNGAGEEFTPVWEFTQTR